MSTKFKNGQRVKIILVKDQHLHPKYEKFEFQTHVNETGKVVDYYCAKTRELPRLSSMLPTSDYCFYTIILDKNKREQKGIPEDALEAIE